MPSLYEQPTVVSFRFAMPDVKARIESLLALANDESASEEERRTSAQTAASLITKHGFTVAAPAATNPEEPAYATSTPTPTGSSPNHQNANEAFESLRREVEKRDAAKSPELRAVEREISARAKLTKRLEILAFVSVQRLLKK